MRAVQSRIRGWYSEFPTAGDQKVDQWLAEDDLPARRPNGDSSTRRWIPGLALRPGDQIRIVGFPEEGERAPLDYIEIHPRPE